MWLQQGMEQFATTDQPRLLITDSSAGHQVSSGLAVVWLTEICRCSFRASCTIASQLQLTVNSALINDNAPSSVTE